MGQVRDIMEKNVVTITEEKTALEAACLISEKDISFLVIVKEQTPIGVVTERDFLRKISVLNKQASEVKLSEIMSYKFRGVEPTTEIEDAVQKMLNHNIRRFNTSERNKKFFLSL